MRVVTLAVLLCGATSAAGQQPVIVRNENIALDSGVGSFRLVVYFTPDHDENFAGSAPFSYSGHSIEATCCPTASGQKYYFVNPGDVFHSMALPQNSLGFSEVGTGDFYIGIWNLTYIRGSYGWARLRPVGGVLTMVENVMAYNVPGIVVGTTTIVPEPTPALLVSAVAIILAPLRIPRRQRIPPRGNARRVEH